MFIGDSELFWRLNLRLVYCVKLNKKKITVNLSYKLNRYYIVLT